LEIKQNAHNVVLFDFDSNAQSCPLMNEITRIGNSHRWSDVVIYGGAARWVEIAEDAHLDARGQIAQVLSQIDATLMQIGSDRSRILEVTIFLADLQDAPVLNALWDQWVPAGHAPIRACVQVGLGGTYRIEAIITAAV
jgi:enamine deaminase RidA (YjgF/YER057c/UK114 family)